MKMYESSQAVEGYPPFSVSLTIGAGESGFCSYSKDVIQRTDTQSYIYTLYALGFDHTLWTIGPRESQAHHLRPVMALGSTHEVTHTLDQIEIIYIYGQPNPEQWLI